MAGKWCGLKRRGRKVAGQRRKAGRRWVGQRMPASLDAAFDMAGLTVREAHVIRERLAGRSHGEIGADVEVAGDGPALSRQRVAQVEAEAMYKLGADVTIADIHASERLARGAVLLAKGRLVRPSELHAEPAAW